MKESSLLFVLLCCMGAIAVIEAAEYREKNNTVRCYDNYRQKTEMLLDSLVSEDDGIFSTQVGIEYLEAKKKLDECTSK